MKEFRSSELPKVHLERQRSEKSQAAQHGTGRAGWGAAASVSKAPLQSCTSPGLDDFSAFSLFLALPAMPRGEAEGTVSDGAGSLCLPPNGRSGILAGGAGNTQREERAGFQQQTRAAVTAQLLASPRSYSKQGDVDQKP